MKCLILLPLLTTTLSGCAIRDRAGLTLGLSFTYRGAELRAEYILPPKQSPPTAMVGEGKSPVAALK